LALIFIPLSLYFESYKSIINWINCRMRYLSVIHFQSSQVFSGLKEKSLVQSFSNIPVNKCSFGVHTIEFLIIFVKYINNRAVVTQKAAWPLRFTHCLIFYKMRASIVYADFEASRTPVDKTNHTFASYFCDSIDCFFWSDVSTVE